MNGLQQAKRIFLAIQFTCKKCKVKEVQLVLCTDHYKPAL